MNNYQINIENNTNETAIELSGSLTINNIENIQKEFIQLPLDKDINLSVKDVEDADITLFQLLKSFAITAKQKNIECQINLELPNNIQELYNRANLNTIN